MTDQLALKEDQEDVALAGLTDLDDSGTEGLEDIDQDDLMIPRVRVIQPTSQLDGPPGAFHNNLSGQTKAAIRAALLKVTKSRVFWNTDDLKAAPLCASDDAKVPQTVHAGKYAQKCDGCELAQWGKDKSGNPVPPQCRLTYNFLAADLDDDDTPFILSLAGASVKSARQIISVFVLKRKKLFSRPVYICANEVKNDKGRFYVVVITQNGGGGVFDWRPYQEMYLGLKATAITADTEVPVSEETLAKEKEEIPY